MDTADRVVLSYPTDLSDWGRDAVEDDPFRAYLRRAHDVARPGDAWAEFTGVGCCGDVLDVPLRVESVDGGHRVSEATTFAFAEREETTETGGWRVQSADGPTAPAGDGTGQSGR